MSNKPKQDPYGIFEINQEAITMSKLHKENVVALLKERLRRHFQTLIDSPVWEEIKYMPPTDEEPK